jgi:trimeric autotransporter adhesin
VRYQVWFVVASIILLYTVFSQGHRFFYAQDYLLDKAVVRHFLYAISEPAAYTHTGKEIGDGGPATAAVLNDPTGIYIDDHGAIFVAERKHHRIRKIFHGIISTVAGNGRSGFSGDGLLASLARLSHPGGLVGDRSGNLLLADTLNHRIRRISSDGTITTVAGNGERGFVGDGRLAVEARLKSPTDICLGSSGALYVADFENHRIRRISSDGMITTVAGNGQAGFSGDGGPAIQASLNTPYGVAVDQQGNFYIADSKNHRIRKVSRDGIITTVAGTGVASFSGDGGMATAAQLNSPQALFITASNDMYINDEHNHRIRKVAPSGIIETVAGNGKASYAGDGGRATQASLNDPEDVWVDMAGNLFITDGDNHRIRKVDTRGIITTIAGGGVVTYE